MPWRPGKGNDVTDILHTGEIHYKPFKTESETGMWTRSPPARIKVPPEELRLKYSELKTLEKKPKEPWRAWSSTGMLEGQQQRAMPGDRMRGPMDRGGQMEDNMPRRGPPQQ